MRELQILTIDARPMAGSHIDRVKQEAKNLAISFKCRVKFYHNDKEFIADKEGNIAQTN